MKSFSGIKKNITALLLCFVMLAGSVTAFAEAEIPEAVLAEVSANDGDTGIIDTETIQGMLDDYIQSHGLNGEHISIGYCYTETGDTWFYNPDKWYYSASTYKLPLFMVMAEKEYNGEFTQDSDINGMKLSELEDMVLINSNNYYAHHVLNYLGETPVETMEGNRKGREMYLPYANLPREYYVDNFFDYSYFTARFLTNVTKTLYFENERFPGIVERLKLAQPNEYFNKKLGGRYEVAQKYGALNDVNGVPFNHTTGIIYTPHPFILTVMTDFMGLSDETIADMALLFEQYTLSLDSKLQQFREEEAEAERLQAEEEKRLAEEAERAEQERIAEEQRKAEEEAQRIENERIAAEKAARKEKLTKVAVILGAAGGAAVLVILIIAGIRKKSHGRTEEKPLKKEKLPKAEKKPKAEKTPKAAAGRNRSQGDHYKPKH